MLVQPQGFPRALVYPNEANDVPMEKQQTLVVDYVADNESPKTSRLFRAWVVAHFGVTAIASLLWVTLLVWLFAKAAVNFVLAIALANFPVGLGAVAAGLIVSLGQSASFPDGFVVRGVENATA